MGRQKRAEVKSDTCTRKQSWSRLPRMPVSGGRLAEAFYVWRLAARKDEPVASTRGPCGANVSGQSGQPFRNQHSQIEACAGAG